MEAIIEKKSCFYCLCIIEKNRTLVELPCKVIICSNCFNIICKKNQNKCICQNKCSLEQLESKNNPLNMQIVERFNKKIISEVKSILNLKSSFLITSDPYEKINLESTSPSIMPEIHNLYMKLHKKVFEIQGNFVNNFQHFDNSNPKFSELIESSYWVSTNFNEKATNLSFDRKIRILQKTRSEDIIRINPNSEEFNNLRTQFQIKNTLDEKLKIRENIELGEEGLVWISVNSKIMNMKRTTTRLFFQVINKVKLVAIGTGFCAGLKRPAKALSLILNRDSYSLVVMDLSSKEPSTDTMNTEIKLPDPIELVPGFVYCILLTLQQGNCFVIDASPLNKLGKPRLEIIFGELDKNKFVTRVIPDCIITFFRLK